MKTMPLLQENLVINLRLTYHKQTTVYVGSIIVITECNYYDTSLCIFIMQLHI